LTTALDARSASVVICAYTDRRWEVLTASIDATLDQRPPPREIVLVVDHNDPLLRRCRAQMPQQVRVLPNTKARGLSGARNTGIQHATGALVIFLDDDAVPEPGWMAALLRPYTDPRVAGVGGGVVPAWNAGQPQWLPAEFWWTVGCSYKGLPTDSAPIRNAIGANMSFRRSVFEEVGSFTDGIGRLGSVPLGCEETEFSIRLRQQMPHVVILYVPHARVSHLVPDERARWRYFVSRCWSEGLSKALVARAVGQDDALSSERAHTLRVLPTGVARGLYDMCRGDLWGAARAAVIVVGLAVTASGYVAGALRRHSTAESTRASG
jgi:GT2 family glycosyltransferase